MFGDSFTQTRALSNKKRGFFFLAGGEINEFSVFHMQTNTQNREPESVDFVNFLYVVDDVYDDDDVDFFLMCSHEYF